MGPLNSLIWIEFIVSLLMGHLLISFAQSQCTLQDGQCTYNVNLSPPGSCSQQTGTFISYGPQPQEIREREGDKMNRMQQDFNTVKSDHENRIRELENSIQKVLRNAIPTTPVEYNSQHSYSEPKANNQEKVPERSGNILLFQLQSQFNRLAQSLSERTADLLDARNKLNETTDLLTAAQKQTLDSSSYLASLQTKATVLERETNILENKLKDKTERLDYANERLNTSEVKLLSVETQLYDIVRAEAKVREELETLKVMFEKSQKELEEVKRNHTEIETKYKKAKRTLHLREEELMDCYSAKTQTFCGFEDPNLCGFTQENGTDVFNWDRHQGRTPSTATGPEYDHTCKGRHGYFMYIEASGKTKGHNARMKSPSFRGLGAQCAEFYYHMSGRHIGTLTVFDKVLASDEFRSIWRVYGNQGNIWIKASISISEETAQAGYQLIFEGSVEQGYEGDIAIDDFRIRDGACATDVTSQEITQSPQAERERKRLLKEQIERYRKMLRRRQKMRNRASAENKAQSA